MCDDDGYASAIDVFTAAQRFQHRMQVAMDQTLEGLGLSFAQYRILELLDSGQPRHLSDIARQLRVTRQATQATASKLVRGGLVELEREPHAAYALLTPVGRRRLGVVRTALTPLLDAFERAMPGGRRHRMVELLTSAERSLDPPREPPWWLSA